MAREQTLWNENWKTYDSATLNFQSTLFSFFILILRFPIEKHRVSLHFETTKLISQLKYACIEHNESSIKLFCASM